MQRGKNQEKRRESCRKKSKSRREVTATITARKQRVSVKKVDVQARKSERICKGVTTRLFENSSNLEEGAELKLLDYSFDSNDDTHPCIYCNEPFKESYANESCIQGTEPSCLKCSHCLCAGVNSQKISLVCELCL